MPQMMKIGQVILGRYEVIEPMAEGGQASLARGHDQRTGMEVAIKQLNIDPGNSGYAQAVARFKRAANLHIEHPAVVDPIDFGEEEGAYYMVMPYIEGDDLEGYLRKHGGKLKEDETMPIADALADGLAAIHAHGVVHRDIKPGNIRIDGQDYPHILDLGICKMVNEATITGDTGGLLGSLCWMSPEQFLNSGGEGPRSDIYSLGGVFYLMLAGVGPARGNTPAEIAVNTCQQDPIPLRQLVPTLSETVERACMCALARSPEGRFQSAQEFRAGLEGEE